ncbi:MAG: nucleotidyltransferase domain-containing protein [Magnetococcales bacterium]|nr:nucleotidyltransferase domain-containing protein [Magnetococcales bacterium]NGZ27848.1 nucleotidyltransferase domain-containing protein [Magnetococcales bacterium]
MIPPHANDQAVTQNRIISSETIRNIVLTIVKHCHPSRIILFGSYAHGNPGQDSDLDLLVVMPSSLPRHKRALPIRMLFRPSLCPMDILVYTQEEVDHWLGTVNHIITNAFQSGKVFYERA